MDFSCLLHSEIVKTKTVYLAQQGSLKSDLASAELLFKKHLNWLFANKFFSGFTFQIQKLLAAFTCTVKLAAFLAASDPQWRRCQMN